MRQSVLLGLTVLVTAGAPLRAERVDFNRDVLPVLASRCFACHGPDAKQLKADLRLDQADSATRVHADGSAAIRPGKPEASELVKRIFATEKHLVMPPAKSNKTLTDAEKGLLRQWVAEGGEYRTHWAFVTPTRPTPPEVKKTGWVRNPVDRFVLARLEKAGLTPSPEADRTTLIRRVSLDLRGLPPTIEEVDAFLADTRADAYERMVDRMLASPHHGEKMATIWMDLARYGDTNGYHYDSTRQVWLWRNWVIRAYNANMPFDQFTIEQLAGDLLPEATVDQRIASGFNRNSRYNEEGGADPAEFLVRYAVDRTNTLGQVWLGLTLGCAECHSHKYDPITQKEFYQLYAFFNSLNEPGAQGHRQKYPPLIEVPTPEHKESITRSTAEITRLEQQIRAEVARLREAGQDEDALQKGLRRWAFGALADKRLPEPVRKVLQTPEMKRNPQQTQVVRAYYVEHVYQATRKVFGPLHKELKAAQDRLANLEKAVPFQIVSVELDKPREAHVLMRGDFQKPGEKVERAVPGLFPGLPRDQPKNRLGLAHWIVDPKNPLTARVTVNRYWAQLMGRGIVETVGDFGTQGKAPTHPQLLDWLAVEFVEGGWDTRAVLRTILLSATYQQQSINDHRHDAVDPENRLLWRAPRFRLAAEEIRDGGLRISGLLTPRIGGPPVFPYQPPDYYKGKQGGWRWELSKGEDRYRRGMYTFWRRTTPYPTFIIFDAPDRSECTVARARTNTPLQALVTMNDPQFVEIARVMGQRVLTQGASDLDGKLRFAFRLAVARQPSETEMEVLRETITQQLAHYRANPRGAESLVKAGEYSRPEGLDPIEHAAWTALANVLLNLDETITRE